MSTQVLPPRPDVLTREPELVTAPPATPKRGRRWIAAVAAGTIVLIGAGLAATQAEEATPATTSTPITAPEAPSAAEVAPQAAVLADQVATELTAASNSTTPDEMAGHVYNAADLTQQIADLFVGVDETQVMYLSSASDHLNNSADALLAGDISTATSEIEAATSDINAATAALDSTYGLSA